MIILSSSEGFFKNYFLSRRACTSVQVFCSGGRGLFPCGYDHRNGRAFAWCGVYLEASAAGALQAVFHVLYSDVRSLSVFRHVIRIKAWSVVFHDHLIMILESTRHYRDQPDWLARLAGAVGHGILYDRLEGKRRKLLLHFPVVFQDDRTPRKMDC